MVGQNFPFIYLAYYGFGKKLSKGLIMRGTLSPDIEWWNTNLEYQVEEDLELQNGNGPF